MVVLCSASFRTDTSHQLLSRGKHAKWYMLDNADLFIQKDPDLLDLNKRLPLLTPRETHFSDNQLRCLLSVLTDVRLLIINCHA